MNARVRQIVRAASMQTRNASQTAGLLNPEQSREFLRMAFEDTPLMKLCRHEMRVSPKGEIDKIGIGGRIIQAKTECVAGTDRAVSHTTVDYSCTDITLPWSITEKLFRENIEREGYEDTVAAMMASAFGVDVEDLGINGDTEYTPESEDADEDFIKICDGWGKKLKEDAHLIETPTWGLDMWYEAAEAIPSK